MMLQTLVIGILILYYTRGSRASAVYAAVYIGMLSYLMSPAAPLSLVWTMQLSVMPLIAAARVGYFCRASVLSVSFHSEVKTEIVSGQESTV